MAKSALQDNASIAISDKTAERLFGSEEPIGKIVTYSGRKLVVRGVYTIPGKSSMAPNAVTCLMDGRLVENKDNWGNFNYGLLLKLKNPADKDKVSARMVKILHENRAVRWAKEEGLTIAEWMKKNGPGKTQIILEPLKDARLHAITEGYAEGKGNYQFLLIMRGLS